MSDVNQPNPQASSGDLTVDEAARDLAKHITSYVEGSTDKELAESGEQSIHRMVMGAMMVLEPVTRDEIKELVAYQALLEDSLQKITQAIEVFYNQLVSHSFETEQAKSPVETSESVASPFYQDDKDALGQLLAKVQATSAEVGKRRDEIAEASNIKRSPQASPKADVKPGSKPKAKAKAKAAPRSKPKPTTAPKAKGSSSKKAPKRGKDS